MTEIEKLLIEMIKIPSVSGQEKAIGEFIFDKLKSLGGFKAAKQAVKDGNFNVVARKGKSRTWIVAHMDTVPGEVPFKVTGEKIYGRGSTDNKASVAGAIMAARELPDINLLFTVGEEKDFCGAEMARRIIGQDKAIVMEATKFEIYTSQRGVIDFVLRSRGEQKHSSLIEKADENAFHRLISVIDELLKKNWTAFNVGVMTGGLAVNIVAGQAEAKISARPETPAERRAIRMELKKLSKSRRVEVEILNDIPPFETKLKIKGKRKKAFTEMAFLPNSLLFGGGDLSIAHSAEENIARKDLNRLPEKLIDVVKMMDRLD